MKKTLIIGTCTIIATTIIAMLIVMGAGTTLYVDANDGSCSDNYNRTEASNPATPWCGQNNTMFFQAEAGDQIQFAPGWYRPTTGSGYSIDNIYYSTKTRFYCETPGTCNVTGGYNDYWNSNSWWTNAFNTTETTCWTATRISTSASLVVFHLFTNDTPFYPVDIGVQSIYNDDLPAYRSLWNTTGTDTSTLCGPSGWNPNNGDIRAGKAQAFDLNNIDNIQLDGFDQYCDAYCVYALSGNDNLTLSNNTFHGGLEDFGAIRTNTGAGLEILQNTFTRESPTHSYLNWSWVDQKYGDGTETSGIYVYNPDNAVRIERNNITGYFNGIAIIASSTGKAEDSLIRYNTLDKLGDDALEFEDYANGYTISYNNVTNYYDGISLSPADSSQKRSTISFNILSQPQAILWNATSGSYVNGRAVKIDNTPGIENWDIDHNTLIGINVFWFEASDAITNTNITNNLFVATTGRVLSRSGLNSSGTYYNNNNYFIISGSSLFRYWNSDVISTTYTSLANAQSSPQSPGTWDTNSLNQDPSFVNYAGNDFTPEDADTCTGSTTGSYIGAVPCNIDNIAITNIMTKTNGGTTIITNWTLPTEGEYNRILIYLDNTLIGNLSNTTTEYTIEGLTQNTTYLINATPESECTNCIITGDSYTEITLIITDVQIITPTEGTDVETTQEISWSSGVYESTEILNYTIEAINKYGNYTTIASNLADTSYTWNTTEAEWKIGNYTIRVTGYYNATITTSDEVDIEISSPYPYLQVLAFDEDGQQITSTYAYLNNTLNYQNTPYYDYITNYLSEEEYNQTFYLYILTVDGSYSQVEEIITINRLTYQFNYTLTSSKLVMYFEQEDAPFTTNGIIFNERLINGSVPFQNTSVLVVQSDLAEGLVKIVFNYNNTFDNTTNVTTWSNWTQFYEYENDYKMDINETLEILKRSDWTTSYQIKGDNRQPIVGAIVRIYQNEPNLTTPTNWKLIGQRLTNEEGKIYFWADSTSHLWLQITKANYEGQNVIMSAGDEDYTRTDPYIVTLKRNSSFTNTYLLPYIRDKYGSSDNVMYMTIITKAYNDIRVTTDYRQSHTGGTYNLHSLGQCNDYGYCYLTLRDGLDYDKNSTDNLQIYIYETNDLLMNLTLTSKNSEIRTEIIGNKLKETDTDYTPVLLFIASLIITVVFHMLFGSTMNSVAVFSGTLVVVSLITGYFVIAIGATIFLGIVLYILKRVINPGE